MQNLSEIVKDLSKKIVILSIKANDISYVDTIGSMLFNNNLSVNSNYNVKDAIDYNFSASNESYSKAAYEFYIKREESKHQDSSGKEVFGDNYLTIDDYFNFINCNIGTALSKEMLYKYYN